MKTQREKFTQWFNEQKFVNFDADEFISYFETHRRRGVSNDYPPESLWNNILPTLRIVDKLRTHFGRPIVLLSSYRTPAYNKSCGGASKSLHLKFNALDISVSGIAPTTVFNTLKTWRDKKQFTGGLGLYSTFVHIDTRGTNATW